MNCKPIAKCCAPNVTFVRRFRTRRERADRLERYAEALEAELTAVRERIGELTSEDPGGDEA